MVDDARDFKHGEARLSPLGRGAVPLSICLDHRILVSRIPEIIAHRGAPRECLENTLASFARALDQRADGIELDVHATKDGVVVVHHDHTLLMTRDGVVAPVPIADLMATEALSWPLSDGIPMPTLDAVCSLVGDQATVYVEVKALGIEGPLIACLNRHPRVRFAAHAFDHRVPVAVRAQRPETSIGLLSCSYPLSLDGFIGHANVSALWQQTHLIDAALVADAHRLGVRVIAWTENDISHARALMALGVDALCTDTPSALRAALEG